MIVVVELIVMLCKAAIALMVLLVVVVFGAAAWGAHELGGFHLIITPGTVLPLSAALLLIARSRWAKR